MCSSASDSRDYRYRAIDVTVDIEGPPHCLGDVCDILDKHDASFDSCLGTNARLYNVHAIELATVQWIISTMTEMDCNQ